MNIIELYKEWKSLKSESINFQRAGADGVMFDYDRDTYVFNRIKEIELVLFPLLTDRKTIHFDKTKREESWKLIDQIYFSGYNVCVENAASCDQFACNTVTGSVTYAKPPQI